MTEFIQHYLPVFNGHPILAIIFGVLVFAELIAWSKAPGFVALLILFALVVI